MALFTLGQVVATPAALRFCEDNNINPGTLIHRHSMADWGELSATDVKANVEAVQYGDRIFSSYQFKGGKLWVITEADRSSTCLLLPDDY